jgi:hypothetical protein
MHAAVDSGCNENVRQMCKLPNYGRVLVATEVMALWLRSGDGRALRTLALLAMDRRTIHVAVGTTIADRPPHRSVRARLRIRLLRRMSGVEACIGIGVQNAGWRNPPVQDWGKTFPTHLCALTAADQNTLP